MKKKNLQLYFIFWIFLIIFFSNLVFLSLKKYSFYKKEILEVKNEINEENKISKELEKQLNNLETDEYIEKIAREELGFIKKDEIIFNKN